MNLIKSLSYSVDSDLGLDVSSIVIGSFKYHTITMMSSWFSDYPRVYCFIFLKNFLYWYLASICSSMEPNTTPKSYTSILKLQTNNVYAGRLKRLPCTPHTWLPQLNTQPPRPCPRILNWPLFIELNSLVVL